MSHPHEYKPQWPPTRGVYPFNPCAICGDRKQWHSWPYMEPPTPPIPTPGATLPVQTVPGYEDLAAVLQQALDHAQHGKGKERHNTHDAPFRGQHMLTECDAQGGIGFTIGQARKKAVEALHLPTRERQINELLGAINYLAGAVIWLGEENEG